jgi:hypothetical protein
MMLAGESRRTRRKTCLSATLSTTNPTWTDPGANLGPPRNRPLTNHLSHDMVYKHIQYTRKLFENHQFLAVWSDSFFSAVINGTVLASTRKE